MKAFPYSLVQTLNGAVALSAVKGEKIEMYSLSEKTSVFMTVTHSRIATQKKEISFEAQEQRIRITEDTEILTGDGLWVNAGRLRAGDFVQFIGPGTIRRAVRVRSVAKNTDAVKCSVEVPAGYGLVLNRVIVR